MIVQIYLLINFLSLQSGKCILLSCNKRSGTGKSLIATIMILLSLSEAIICE